MTIILPSLFKQKIGILEKFMTSTQTFVVSSCAARIGLRPEKFKNILKEGLDLIETHEEILSPIFCFDYDDLVENYKNDNCKNWEEEFLKVNTQQEKMNQYNKLDFEIYCEQKMLQYISKIVGDFEDEIIYKSIFDNEDEQKNKYIQLLIKFSMMYQRILERHAQKYLRAMNKFANSSKNAGINEKMYGIIKRDEMQTSQKVDVKHEHNHKIDIVGLSLEIEKERKKLENKERLEDNYIDVKAIEVKEE
jgi:hypothetical protein